MDKMKMSSPDLTVANIEKIREMFPNVITEAKDEQGNLVHKVDFEKLKQELSADVIDGDESYDFTWVGKKQAMVEANKPTNKTLRPCLEDSVNWEKTENLYIEGDNLEVLKLLQESYLNKVKMIYIDPPYNTGNDSFIYPDDYTTNKDKYDEEVGAIDESGYRMFKNTETNGRFHSSWCSMMYSRLKVARNLLSDDGVIFISIDDNEVENLKKICDEVFGECNFITQFIWEKTQHFGRQKLNTYCNTDYILCYAKHLIGNKLKELLVERVNTDLLDAPLFNASNNKKILTFPKNTVRFNMRDGIYEKTTSDDYILKNNVIVKNGLNDNDFSLEFRSRWAQNTINDEIKKGTTFWIKTESFAIRAIYGDDKKTHVAPKQIIFTNTKNPHCAYSRFNSRVGTNETASNEVRDLLNSEVFSYPKPVSLIYYILSLQYEDNKHNFAKDFLTLDFFSGSATTAHAVMQLNAEDGGKRKFIMVQLPEICNEKSEAYKAGYKNICEIGKERIRRAGKKIVEETGKTDLDIGFRVFKLDESNMKDVYYTPDELSQSDLVESISNIKDDRSSYDLLYQCMLDWGLELSLTHKTERINNNEVHIVNDGDLIACFDDKVPEETIKQIADKRPLRAVFRDSSFATPAARINVDEIFKLKSPQTTIKVL